jgi:hypothetical protein
MVLVASLNSTREASEDLGLASLGGPFGDMSAAASEGLSDGAFGVSIFASSGDFFASLKDAAHWLQKREFARFSVWHFGHFIRHNSLMSDRLTGVRKKIHNTVSDTIGAEILAEYFSYHAL